MGYFGAVLTLPGIAGVILTVGMGVDSNVLIFERIREELRNGKTPPRPWIRVSATLDHIVDTHVTTIVSARFCSSLEPARFADSQPRLFSASWRTFHGSFRLALHLRFRSGSQGARRSTQHLGRLSAKS